METANHYLILPLLLSFIVHPYDKQRVFTRIWLPIYQKWSPINEDLRYSDWLGRNQFYLPIL